MTAVTLQSVPLQLHDKQRSMASKGDAKDMPEGFAPSEFDVLVGWARQNFHHAGNRRFRDIISGHVPRYSQADSKISRGQIITDIVKEIQSMSPSGTGFLKLNPYTARWNFIGTDKAKDKVGHALRKALMNAEGGENDDSSSKQDEEANQDRIGEDQRRRSNSDNNLSSEKSAGSSAPSSPHESIENSKKRPNSLPRKRKSSPREPLVSILKKTGTSKYNTPSPNGDIRVETMAPGTSTNESDLSSKAFASPANATARMMRPDSSADPHSFSVGLSPVARDMFDEKNEVVDQAALRKRARQKKMNERHGYDTDDTDHNAHRSGLPRHPSSSGSDSSYPEQRVVAAPYAPPPATLAPPIPQPLHHSIVYGGGVHPQHPSAGAPFYYSPHLHHIGSQPPPHAIPPPPPHSIPPPQLPIPTQKQMQPMIMPPSRGSDPMSRRVAEHQQHQHPPPPHYIHAGQGGLAIPPPPTMVPGAPGGMAMVPPPPHMASTMYYPPGYYYYPGFMVPPPTDPNAAAASHHPHVYPQPTAIPYGAPGMMESSYYNQHEHYDHDDDESVNHHRSSGSS